MSQNKQANRWEVAHASVYEMSSGARPKLNVHLYYASDLVGHHWLTAFLIYSNRSLKYGYHHCRCWPVVFKNIIIMIMSVNRIIILWLLFAAPSALIRFCSCSRIWCVRRKYPWNSSSNSWISRSDRLYEVAATNSLNLSADSVVSCYVSSNTGCSYNFLVFTIWNIVLILFNTINTRTLVDICCWLRCCCCSIMLFT